MEVLEGSQSLAQRGEPGRGLPGQGAERGTYCGHLESLLTQQLLPMPAPFPSGMLARCSP